MDRIVEKLLVDNNVIAIVHDGKGKIKDIAVGDNIVTDDDDLYYAQTACGETPDADHTFTSMYLGNGAAAGWGKTDTYDELTLIAGTEKAKSTGYPKTNDQDADNTGAGTDVATWKFEYVPADGNWTGITEACIGMASIVAGKPVLTGFDFAASFGKTSSDYLTVYVNHTMNGV